MWKTFVLQFIFMVISFFCYSQKAAESRFTEEYADTISPNQDHSFYILELNSATPKEFNNNVNISADRILSNTSFIVDKNVLAALLPAKKFLHKITAANNQWKLSPSAQTVAVDPERRKKIIRFTLQLKSTFFLKDLFRLYPDLKQTNFFLPEQNIISLRTTYTKIENLFLNNDQVISIDALLANPKEELGIPGFDFSANKINIAHSQFPTINGLGQHVSIKEDYYDTSDIDLKGRLDNSPLASGNVTNHANFIATIIAGAGNSEWYAKGVAYEANISSASFEQVLPDVDSYYQQQNISVQNHSYGTVIENNYGVNAVAFDKSANDNEGLLHVFSSGNMGTSTGTNGKYANVQGFANLTGNFKMAKNILTIGAVDSFGNVVPLSSRGPAYDGRLKPDLVAFQKNGTSEAAALVSGTALLLQQYYKSVHDDSVLPSALARAILINTADDINNPGPDYASGYGNMNAIKAMDLIKKNRIFQGTITNGKTDTFSINIPSNIALLKVTLSWNDPATSAMAPKALVNDLDLTVNSPATGDRWSPWVLDTEANTDSLNMIATRKRDSLNNVEEVSIDRPVAGNYKINVTGFNLPTGTQKYYVAFSFDSIDVFNWQRLTKTDFAEGGSQNIIRWENSFAGVGDIDYSYISSGEWLPVASRVDLSKNYFYWNAPDTIAETVLRMKIGNRYFYSDTFLITILPNPKTGLICSDSVLIYWNKIKGIQQYEVYTLGSKYMEPIMQIADTSVLLLKNILFNKFIAIAPVLPEGIIAPKSYSFDYTLQGAGCFINSFFAETNGNAAKLSLSIGTTFGISSISFEKETQSGFITFFSPPLNNQFNYSYEYKPLSKGITYFRAKIILTNGNIIYSQKEPVFYVEEGEYLVLPVPVKKNSDINLYTTLPDGEIISVFDMIGRIVFRKEIQSAHEIIRTSSLQAGEYFYRITKNGRRVYSGKLLVL